MSHSFLYQKLVVTNGGITRYTCVYHHFNQSVRVTDGVTVMSLSASLQHKTSAATFHPCQITFKQKLSCIIYAKLSQTEY